MNLKNNGELLKTGIVLTIGLVGFNNLGLVLQ